jgi:hypothetical protein
MTNRNCFFTSLMLIMLPAPALADVQATFHVAPNGSDANPGTDALPFATVERARQAVRTINKAMTGDIVVVVRRGTYRIDRTITFDAEDSGTGGHSVIYRAQPGEKPVISGGKAVTGWRKDEQGRWKATAPLDDFRQLYVGGVRATRARGEAPAGLQFEGEDGYTTTAIDMANWKNPADLEFCYVAVFTHTRCKVASIQRKGDRARITMLQPHFTHARMKEPMPLLPESLRIGKPDYIENALELLDEPGEWYLDRPGRTVYYMPRAGEDMTKVEVVAPAVERLVELRGSLDRPVRNVRFEGITFAHGVWLLPNKIGFVDTQANFMLDWKNPLKRDAGLFSLHNQCVKSPANVVCHATKSVRFERCAFTHLGGAGIDIEFGGQDNVISGCHFHDISGTAVQVGDVQENDHHPKDPRMIVKNNSVVNNYIHDACVEYLGGVGVFVGYTEGTVIGHNEIAHLPYTGISIGWGWGEEDAGGGNPACFMPFKYDTATPAKNNRIEFNNIHHVMQKLADGGAIYTLGNQPGTVIRGNHIHDNPIDPGNAFVRGKPGGIYLDEGSGFIEVTGNLVCDVHTPMNYNNYPQERIKTCKEHGNFFGSRTDGAKPIVEKAGLEAEYRDLLREPRPIGRLRGASERPNAGGAQMVETATSR